MPQGRPRKKSSTRKHYSSALPTLESPRKRLKWKSKSMIKAMDAVSKGNSICKAAAALPGSSALMPSSHKTCSHQ